MPPRRKHTKSRTGCQQCKQRRIKCDERGPICKNCLARGYECSYIHPPQQEHPTIISYDPVTHTSCYPLQPQNPWPASGQTTTTAQPPNHPRESNGGTPTEQWPPSRRILELELMHRYSTSTYLSCVRLRETPETVDLWQRFVPREALKHDFLMYLLFAFAALHIATTGEEEDVEKVDNSTGSSSPRPGRPTSSASSSFYFQKALEYQNLAFAAVRPVLQNVTPDNCSAVFTFSILNMLLAIAIPGVEESHHHRERAQSAEKSRTSHMQSIFTTFEFLRGLMGIIGLAREWLDAGPVHHIIYPYHMYLEGNWHLSNPDTAQALHRLAVLNEELNSPATTCTSTVTSATTAVFDDTTTGVGTTRTALPIATAKGHPRPFDSGAAAAAALTPQLETRHEDEARRDEEPPSRFDTYKRAISHLEFCFSKQGPPKEHSSSSSPPPPPPPAVATPHLFSSPSAGPAEASTTPVVVASSSSTSPSAGGGNAKKTTTRHESPIDGPDSSADAPSDRGHILGWLAMAGRDFVALLREGDPLSLLIFLHWATLLAHLDAFWWSRSSAPALVAEVAGLLHNRGRDEWEERTRWARRKVGIL